MNGTLARSWPGRPPDLKLLSDFPRGYDMAKILQRRDSVVLQYGLSLNRSVKMAFVFYSGIVLMAFSAGAIFGLLISPYTY